MRHKLETLLIIALTFGILYASQSSDFSGAIGLTRQNVAGAPTFYMNHATAGKVTFGTSLTATSDVLIAGEVQVRDLFNGAAADGFIPAAADTDFALGQADDILLDSLRVTSPDFAAGDSIIVVGYVVDLDATGAATVTEFSRDTVIASGKIDYTSIATATRALDLSAGERRSYYMDERGTLTNLLVEEFTRTYDVSE